MCASGVLSICSQNGADLLVSPHSRSCSRLQTIFIVGHKFDIATDREWGEPVHALYLPSQTRYAYKVIHISHRPNETVSGPDRLIESLWQNPRQLFYLFLVVVCGRWISRYNRKNYCPVFFFRRRPWSKRKKTVQYFSIDFLILIQSMIYKSLKRGRSGRRDIAAISLEQKIPCHSQKGHRRWRFRCGIAPPMLRGVWRDVHDIYELMSDDYYFDLWLFQRHGTSPLRVIKKLNYLFRS